MKKSDIKPGDIFRDTVDNMIVKITNDYMVMIIMPGNNSIFIRTYNSQSYKLRPLTWIALNDTLDEGWKKL